MATTFRSYDLEHLLNLSPDLRAWVPEGHLAHHVSDLVDAVDPSAFCVPYAGDRRGALHLRGGAQTEPRDRGHFCASRAEGPLEVREQVAGARLVEES